MNSRTAVIYSGEARTFATTFANQYWHVLRHLPNPEFFVSVQDDAQAADMTRLWERFPAEDVHIEYVEQPTLPEPEPDPKWLNLYPPSAKPQAILRQLWALNRAWEFYGAVTQIEHELVVRIRPDIAFARFELPRHSDTHPFSCYTPWWARWGGVNDRMAYLGKEAAKDYFTTFTKIERLRALGCPLHPEQLIAASLRNGGIEPRHTLAADFITLRLDGTIVPMSVTEIEIAEYARAR